MEQIGDVLQKLVRELDIARPILKYQALALWPEIVGKRISKVTQPQRIRDGRIFVKVKNDAWRNELVFHKQEIIHHINVKVGERVVEEIILL